MEYIMSIISGSRSSSSLSLSLSSDGENKSENKVTEGKFNLSNKVVSVCQYTKDSCVNLVLSVVKVVVSPFKLIAYMFNSFKSKVTMLFSKNENRIKELEIENKNLRELNDGYLKNNEDLNFLNQGLKEIKEAKVDILNIELEASREEVKGLNIDLKASIGEVEGLKVDFNKTKENFKSLQTKISECSKKGLAALKTELNSGNLNTQPKEE
jgi:hypothetical protein